MAKFNTTVKGCTGNVVIGDNAVLTIGASRTDGKRVRISLKISFSGIFHFRFLDSNCNG